MLLVRNIKLRPGYSKTDLEQKLRKKIYGYEYSSYKIQRESLDSRKHDDIHYELSIYVDSKNEDLHQIIMDETNGEGVDRIVMAIGVNALVDSTFKLARRGGTVCLFAGFPKGKMSEFDPSVIHYNEINITGSTAYKRIDYLQAADMVINHKIDLDAIVSAKFKIDEFKQALDLHMAGTALKVLIED